jgi:hypothetical protein
VKNCSYVYHSSNTVDAVDDSQNSGGDDASKGSDGFAEQGGSTDNNILVTNEDFDDVYDNCTSTSGGCIYGENGSGNGYYVPKYNYTKYNYSAYHNSNQNEFSESGNLSGNDGSEAADAADATIDSDASGASDATIDSDASDASGSENESGTSGYDQNGELDSNSNYDEDVQTADYDPYTSFEIGQCDTYERLWIWDLALSCKNDQLLDSCQCTFASQLMSQEMLSCDDISRCPQDCQVCRTCLQLLGCDDTKNGFGSLISSPLWWLLLAVFMIICCIYCYLFALRRRREENEEKGYLGVGLMSEEDASSTTSGSSNGRSKSPLLGSPISSTESTPTSSPIWLAPSIPVRNSVLNNGESNADVLDKLATPTLEPRDGIWLAPIPEISAAQNIEDNISTESTENEQMDSPVEASDSVVDSSDTTVGTLSDVDTPIIWLAPATINMDGNAGENEDEISSSLKKEPDTKYGESTEIESDCNETDSRQLSDHQGDVDVDIHSATEDNYGSNASSDEIDISNKDSTFPIDEDVTLTDIDIAAICDTLDQSNNSVDQIKSDAFLGTEYNQSDSEGTFDYSTDAPTQSDEATSTKSENASDQNVPNDTIVIKRFEW